METRSTHERWCSRNEASPPSLRLRMRNCFAGAANSRTYKKTETLFSITTLWR